MASHVCERNILLGTIISNAPPVEFHMDSYFSTWPHC